MESLIAQHVWSMRKSSGSWTHPTPSRRAEGKHPVEIAFTYIALVYIVLVTSRFAIDWLVVVYRYWNAKLT